MKEHVNISQITETIAGLIEDHFLICNAHGEILFCNPSMASRLGYKESELTSKNFLAFIEKTHSEKAASFFNHATKEPSGWEGFLMVGKKGLKKLHLKFLTKDSLTYIYGNEKYVEYEKIRRKLDREVTSAKKIHQQSLPVTLPNTESLSFSALYRPAEVIGGDLYDVFKVDNGLLGEYFNQYVAYIADVSGHGLDSAMLSIFVKDTIRSFFSLKHIPGQVLSPKEIVHFLVEQYLKEGYPEEYLVCLFLVVFDLNAKDLTYCSAGFHESPFLIKDQNHLLELDRGGMPISAAIDAKWLTYQDTSVKLIPGMTLFLMSDGLPEQRSGKEFYRERFKTLATKLHSLNPKQITDEINLDFTDFLHHQDVEDDITLVVAKISDLKE
jgi:phosphoserine phosphatase RsbU/P